MTDNDSSNMGRPKINGGVKRVLITITESHYAYLRDEYGSISPAIRLLIDADIRQRRDATQAPDKDEQGDGGQGEE
jgi:hypothetical protein